MFARSFCPPVARACGAHGDPGSQYIQLVRYKYVDEEGEAAFEEKEAFRKSLRQVLPRLELLGYTVESARREYEQLQALNRGRVDISFDELASALRLVEVTSVSRYYHGEYDFGEFFSDEIYDRIDLDQVSQRKKPWRDGLGEVMENFHSWHVLRLLAESPRNLDLHVTWYISDVLAGGWTDRTDIVHELPTSQRFLIVTEGSSDAKIIKKATSPRTVTVKPMNIPTELNELLKQNSALQGSVLVSYTEFEPWLRASGTPFFPNYTDHGMKHILEVLQTASSLVRDSAWSVLTPNDAGMAISLR